MNSHYQAGSLYALGGRQRKLVFKDEDESHLYEAALVLEIDPVTGASRVCVEYESPPEVHPEVKPSFLFKAGALQGDHLYVCTSTEVLIYEVPSFQKIGYVSLPCFNDLHHVAPSDDGNLLVANTGLDMVVKLTPEGEVLSEWNVLGEDPWKRFSRQIDYRKIASTKPHRSHPNFVFELDGEPWVTRFTQRDAVCLADPGKRIAIPGEGPHDGLVLGEEIWFTTVDGKIVVADRDGLRVSRVLDLARRDGDRRALLGWCRGLMPAGADRLWVGFTRVRKTAFKENLLWIKHAFRATEQPTHLALYDLKTGTCPQEIDLEQHGMNVVFGIYPAAQKPAGKADRPPSAAEIPQAAPQ